MKEFLLSSPADYKVMCQTGVKQFVYPLDSIHNAIWDARVTRDGTLYFALATELTTAGYVRLCKYDFETNTVTECFRAEDVIMPSYKAIRASKFHTSIWELEDGRLIMTTHTTDRSPLHPSWMPYAYYHHIWEGYAGSNIILYDPKTGKAENLGIPVPHESIYGAAYDAKHNALFFTGMFRGHAYRYDLDKHELLDFGQVSENYAWRLLFDKNGDIIGGSRSGYLYKIDTNTLKLRDLNYRLPVKTYPAYTGGDFKCLSNGCIGPDGRLYMIAYYGRNFVAYDSDTDTFEDMGDYMPGFENYVDGETRNGSIAMEFDNEGVLWYVIFGRNCSSGIREKGLPSSLFRWDIARGGKPEWMGICGTKARSGSWTSELRISKDDIMYIIGSNHAADGPDITAVDLKQFRKDMYNFGDELLEDEYYVNPHSERYEKMADMFFEQEEIGEQNPWAVTLPMASKPTRLWRALAPDHVADSCIKAMCWEDDVTLSGVCGNEKEYLFRTVNGELTELIEKENDLARYEALMATAKIAPVDNLPFYPGRQYQAVATASAEMAGGKQVIGTNDGMLAVKDGDKVFGLGPAVYNGPVRCLRATPDGSKVYGVGGHEDDIGMVFSYDETEGLRWLGHASYAPPSDDGAFHCSVLSCCAISPDGKRLAIGSDERLGQILYYSIG